MSFLLNTALQNRAYTNLYEYRYIDLLIDVVVLAKIRFPPCTKRIRDRGECYISQDGISSYPHGSIYILGSIVVTMQAQKSAPADMQCKNKFLIQCTVVQFDTTEAEIPPMEDPSQMMPGCLIAR
ncbi:unnamed protein product [Fraxinus pennsylvanica]|uniref:Uncharacterized protein n=1 Tax=Fraxinus pennsylvanica TaxID=56036 RepID=A0AAD2EAD2_9LAMI|nr:unnamed protein product [Fraxinus pennsylvanica]